MNQTAILLMPVSMCMCVGSSSCLYSLRVFLDLYHCCMHLRKRVIFPVCVCVCVCVCMCTDLFQVYIVTPSHTHTATGPILGIVCAGLIAIVTIIFCIITISSISCQVKQYNRHRAQFQQLCSLVSIQPQTTPTTHMLRSHRPRFGEWYQTSEGHWFQGPPPAYSPGDEQTSSLSNEGRGSLNGGLGDTAASSAPVQVVLYWSHKEYSLYRSMFD